MTSEFLTQFNAARRVSTPLIAIQTPDPASTIAAVQRGPNGYPIFSWDIARGILPLNSQAVEVLSDLSIEGPMMTNPTETLLAAQRFPKKSILFFFNAQLFTAENVEGRSAVIQAIWNLRDLFKQDGRTLVLLTPGITLPAELSQDVLVLDEPLPDRGDLSTIVTECYESAGLTISSMEIITKAVDALKGLSGFTAEQATMMSLSKAGLDLPGLWERKRTTIEQTPGLSVYRGTETFNEVGGVENAKKFLTRVLLGREAPNVVVFIDEIEKSLAGAQGDLSGTSQEMLGTLLSWMQDKAVTGIIAIGPPGCSKSMIAKATGNTAKIPTIIFDLSGMKGSLVGESGKNLRQALKVVDAVSNNKVLCIATCNSIGALPPELRRRFTFGTFFFDLPDAEEREAIWKLYLNSYNPYVEQVMPEDNGWTGAEIKQCCDIAYRLDCSLLEAAQYLVPVAKSSADLIEKLRTQASGKFISASKPGVYRYEKEATSARRKIDAV